MKNTYLVKAAHLMGAYSTKELRSIARTYGLPVNRTWLGQKSTKGVLAHLLALPTFEDGKTRVLGELDDILHIEDNDADLYTEAGIDPDTFYQKWIVGAGKQYWDQEQFLPESSEPSTPNDRANDANDRVNDRVNTNDRANDATTQLGALIQQIAGSSVNESRVRQIVDEAVSELGGGGITINLPAPSDPIKLDGHQHASFTDLLTLTNCGNVWLTGPAGSGKTTGASNVAKALGLPFYAVSVGPQTTKTDMFGYTVAGTGEYKPSLLFTAYTEGGVLLLDEADTCHAGVAKQLKVVLGQEFASFDGRMVERHPDFRVIACANTVGQRSSAYVSAQAQDQAFLDEWLILDWGYDEVLEDKIVKAYAAKDSTKRDDINKWVGLVRKARKAITDTGETKALASPRATIKGCKLLLSGVSFDTVKKVCLTNVWGSRDLERKLLG